MLFHPENKGSEQALLIRKATLKALSTPNPTNTSARLWWRNGAG